MRVHLFAKRVIQLLVPYFVVVDSLTRTETDLGQWVFYSGKRSFYSGRRSFLGGFLAFSKQTIKMCIAFK